MKKFIRENKLVSGILLVFIGSCITYAVAFPRWVVNQIYCQNEKVNTHIAVQEVEKKEVSQQVKEVKEEVKAVKEELTSIKKEAGEEGIKLRKDIADNQKELLKLLIDIKRDKK